MPPRDVLQNDNLQVPRLVLALRNSQGNVDRASDARWPHLLASDDPSGLSGLPVSTLIVDADGATLSQVDTDGSTLKTFRTTAAGGTQPDLIFAAATELTIASGVVTATQGSHTIDTESDAASDNLDQIAGLAAEELLLIRPANAARTVVLRDASVAGGAANIYTPGRQSISLAEAADWALLASDGTNVVVLAYRTQALAGGGLGAALAAITTGLGASLVGIEDSGSLITATNVETALAEIAAKANVVTRETTTVGAKVVLPEGTNNGAHTLTLQGPASLAASRTVTFPDTDVDLTTIGTHTGQIAALGAENTDGNIDIPLRGVATSGVWAWAITSVGIQTLTRTVGAATEYFWIPIPMPHRSSASKGIKPTGLDMNYSVNTADATDITFEVWARTLGANGSAPTAAVLFGEDDADYDSDHNTAAKRGLDAAAPQLHRATLTNAGTPAYVGADESLWLRIKVIDPGLSAVVITGAKLRYSETLVDLS